MTPRARTPAGGGDAGLFEPIMKWLRKKIQRSRRHHHVFQGEVRRGRDGSLVGSGWHHRFMGRDPVDRRVTGVTDRDPNGTYRADVQFRGPNGTWLDKPAGSSFFPDNWTPQRVDRVINQAFDNHTVVPGTNNRRWRADVDGVLVEGSFHPNGRTWNSAWPIVNPGS